jgi:hypothetical protein
VGIIPAFVAVCGIAFDHPMPAPRLYGLGSPGRPVVAIVLEHPPPRPDQTSATPMDLLAGVYAYTLIRGPSLLQP